MGSYSCVILIFIKKHLVVKKCTIFFLNNDSRYFAFHDNEIFLEINKQLAHLATQSKYRNIIRDDSLFKCPEPKSPPNKV